jgi:hypothetical protein
VAFQRLVMAALLPYRAAASVRQFSAVRQPAALSRYLVPRLVAGGAALGQEVYPEAVAADLLYEIPLIRTRGPIGAVQWT